MRALVPLSSRRSRFRGERGVAVIMTALVLVPLMVFAAYGVDLAGFYSRVSQLQRAADAAALAGTVWMPDYDKARTEAASSLAKNGFVHGSNGIVVTYAQGARLNSLQVTVEDTSVTTYFSKVIGHRQAIARSAEAQYNLPLPLGSPLNYFGGDATRTAPPQVFTHEVDWPTDFTTRVPANAPCNIGTAADQSLGRWAGSPPTYRSNEFSGAVQCGWSVLPDISGGTSAVPPPDYMVRQPTNAGGSGCRVRTNGNSNPTLGRWQGGSFTTSTNGTGSLSACTWQNASTNVTSLPPTPTATRPQAWPCRIGYETARGWWNGSGSYSTTGTPAGNNQTAGNILCRWPAEIRQVDVTPPNPIDASRSPGFWAAVEGPNTRAIQGDAFSTRCWGNSNGCSSAQNQMYQPLTDTGRGYWYVVKVPPNGSGVIDINVYDAAHNPGATEVGAGDRNLDGSGMFTTQFTVYKQTHPLDFSQRTMQSGCQVSVTNDADWRDQWRRLCQVTASGDDIFQVNVQTIGTAGAGVNGYALEAVRNGSHANPFQPALYAYSAMQMQNNNFCTGSCTPPPATFYIAEVGPQYAGKILVMELWDPGDVSGTATMYPVMPATTSTNPSNPNLPRPVIPVPSSRCSFTADSEPNNRSGISGIGTLYTTPQSPDVANCGIRTSTGSGARFNGEWLRIRIEVPGNYTCTPGVNPEVSGGSCWWGIRYEFSDSANDVTTWRARIEGNPVHLTE